MTVLPQYGKSHAYMSRCIRETAEVATAQSQDTSFCVLLLGRKILCELRKFQQITGSSYAEIIQEDMSN